LLIKYFKVKTLDPNEEEGRIGRGPGVVDINDKDAAAAKTRQWDREKSVRTLP